MDRNIGLIKQRLNMSDSRLTELYKSFLGLSMQVDTLITEMAGLKETISNDKSLITDKKEKNSQNVENNEKTENITNNIEVEETTAKTNKKKTYERNIRVIN